MDLFNKVLKEAEDRKNDQALLDKYEKTNNWDFVDLEDLGALNNIAEGFAKVCGEYFGYDMQQWNQGGNSDGNKAYICVEGFGYRGEINEYIIYLRPCSDDGDGAGEATFKWPTRIWGTKTHQKVDFHAENFVKAMENKFKSTFEKLCSANGFTFEKVRWGRFRSYCNDSYFGIKVVPSSKIDALNNKPVAKKLQDIVDLIVKEFSAQQLAKRDETIYWIANAGHEGSEIIFTTCLTMDDAKEYPSDDERGYSENPNYQEPILYLDAPNLGYANWNTGTGYITGHYLNTRDDVRHVAKNFCKYLSDVANKVYENSNY